MNTTTNQQQSPNSDTIIAIVLLFIMGYILMFAVTGCNTQRKINKAVMVVQSDSAAMQKMRANIERLYPCIPVIGKPGKTVVITRSTLDTAQVRRYKKSIDSLIGKTLDTANIRQQLLDSFSPEILTYYETRVDTVVDQRAIELMQDRYNALKQISDQLEGQYKQQDKTIAADIVRQNKGAMWHLIIGIILVSGLGIGVVLKYKL